MARVDFQELLNKKVVNNSKKERNIQILLDILEKKNKESMSNFLDMFVKKLVSKKNKGSKLQDKVDVEKEDDGDISIADMMAGKDTPAKEKEEEVEQLEIPQENDIPGVAEISEEELEEKYPGNDLSTSQKKYAFVYEKAMTEYYNLKINLERQNIKDGSVCYDDRNFLKLMRLREVAVRSEMWFKNSTKGKYIGEAIQSIGELENQNQRECAEYQRQNNLDHEASLKKIDDLNKQIEECLEIIQQLSVMVVSADENQKGNILAELSKYQDRYVDLNEKLEVLTPNALELARKEEKSLEQQQFEDNEFGYVDKVKTRTSDTIEQKNLNYIRQQEYVGENIDQNGASVSNSEREAEIQETKEIVSEAAQEEIINGNSDVASELITGTSEMFTKDIDESDDRDIEENVEKVNNQIAEKELEKESILDDTIDGKVAATAIITGTVAGALDSYPEKADVGENELSKRLNELVYSPEEVADITVKNDSIDEIEKISNGEKAKEESEPSIDDKEI